MDVPCRLIFALRAMELNSSLYPIALMIIANEEEIRSLVLAKVLKISQAASCELIARLAKRGLVKWDGVNKHPSSGRPYKLVSITQKGRDLLK